MRTLSWLIRPQTQGPGAVLLVRAAVGLVFLSSGLLKFLYANQGVGRFAHIGLPFPEILSPFVGFVEMTCGLMVLIGLWSRLAAIPLMIDMIVAISTTKIPLLFGPGPEPVSAPPKTGMWAFAYQARLDFTMLLAAGFVLAVGAGVWSLDAWLARRRPTTRDRPWQGHPMRA